MPAQFFRDGIADSSTLCPAPQQHPADNIDLCNHHTVIFPHLTQGKPGSVGSKRRGRKWSHGSADLSEGCFGECEGGGAGLVKSWPVVGLSPGDFPAPPRDC